MNATSRAMARMTEEQQKALVSLLLSLKNLEHAQVEGNVREVVLACEDAFLANVASELPNNRFYEAFGHDATTAVEKAFNLKISPFTLAKDVIVQIMSSVRTPEEPTGRLDDGEAKLRADDAVRAHSRLDIEVLEGANGDTLDALKEQVQRVYAALRLEPKL